MNNNQSDTLETDAACMTIQHDDGTTEIVVNADLAKQLERERDESRKQRDVAIKHIAEWCVAINENGGGWDYWDDYYKDAFYSSPTDELPEIRSLLTDAIAKAKGDANK